MNFDIILEGNAYVNGIFQNCCIGIKEGKIQAIKKVLSGGKKKHFSKELILPSGIDIHVHFRDPGFPQKETFLTGSTAAAFGGITCVFDMPNTKPQTTRLSDVKEKIKHANEKTIVDFGIYGAICDHNIENFLQLQDVVHGFKIFLGSSTNALELSSKNLHSLLSKEKRINKPVLFHAEDSNCLSQNKGVEQSLKDHHLRRPPACETQAIQSILHYAPFPFPVHICHISSKESLQLLNTGHHVISRGVTPHHSLLSIDHTKIKNHTWYKTNPPIRTMEHQNYLFHGLLQGSISILESDHAPHGITEKDTSFQQAPSGISGVETMFPLFLYKAWKQEISFERIISLICEKPAELMNIKKGKITCDYDADLIIIDPKKQENISSLNLHSKANFTPFEGEPAIFPKHVYLRGEPIIEDNELIVNPGNGDYIETQQSI